MAPIDIVNAAAQVASGRQALIASQTNFQLQQVLMCNALTRTQTDSVLASAEVIPTDRMELPPSEPAVTIQDLISGAVQNRPELAQSRLDLANRQLSKNSARNALLPAVDFVANYGGSALAGNMNPSYQNFGGGTVPVIRNTGFTTAFSGMNDHPTYSVGFNITIPIMNRSAQADQIRSELEYRQAQVGLQQQQNGIVIDVRNAQVAVQQNRAQVEAARAARDYQHQSLIAEQKRLAQGSSTTFSVLQMMSNLDTAESNFVNAMTAYQQSRMQLDVVTGTMLTKLGIDIADAVSAHVSHMPHVPSVAPAKSTNLTHISAPSESSTTAESR